MHLPLGFIPVLGPGIQTQLSSLDGNSHSELLVIFHAFASKPLKMGGMEENGDVCVGEAAGIPCYVPQATGQA